MEMLHMMNEISWLMYVGMQTNDLILWDLILCVANLNFDFENGNENRALVLEMPIKNKLWRWTSRRELDLKDILLDENWWKRWIFQTGTSFDLLSDGTRLQNGLLDGNWSWNRLPDENWFWFIKWELTLKLTARRELGFFFLVLQTGTNFLKWLLNGN